MLMGIGLYSCAKDVTTSISKEIPSDAPVHALYTFADKDMHIGVYCIDGTQYGVVKKCSGTAMYPLLGTDGMPKGCE
jgi:hypothetical protein